MDWRSKQQSVVVPSTKEDEYIALSSVVRDVLLTRKLRRDLEKFLDQIAVDKQFDISVNENNQACIADVQNASVPALSKHVDLKSNSLLKMSRKVKSK